MGRARSRRGERQGVLEFGFGWGGARAGAGRKPKGERAGVPHRTRASLASRFPVHVTTRIGKGLPSLRRRRTRFVLERAFRRGKDRFGFRLVQYSVQSNHLHLLAEARDRRALSRGLQGLFVRVARGLNKHWGRKGTVFADRYHDRILRTPREVRAALAYVLLNARRHGVGLVGVDLFSSGDWFRGWRKNDRRGPVRTSAIGRFPPVVLARTWLLRMGWRRYGRIGLAEVPGG